MAAISYPVKTAYNLPLVEYTLIVVLVFWVAIKNTNIGSGLAPTWSKISDCVSAAVKL
jgi:Flp pilus assembly pilin Flp